MTIGDKFQSLTNLKKNSKFLCSGDSRYPSVDTVKLGKTLKNMGDVLAEIAGLLMKKHTSFPSKICPVF